MNDSSNGILRHTSGGRSRTTNRASSGWTATSLGGFLVHAGLCGGREHALACLLALNGLRISETLGADIDDFDHNRCHRTLFVLRKGGKTATIPLAPHAARALDLYIDERSSGPIFMNQDMTRRLDGHAATRIVKRLAKAAGIGKRISPHSSRHGSSRPPSAPASHSVTSKKPRRTQTRGR